MDQKDLRDYLQFLEVGLELALSDKGAWANPIKVEAERDAQLRETILAFSSFLATGAPQEVTVTVRVPSSWWQHWKQDAAAHLPRQLRLRVERGIKRVSHAETKTTYATVCPHINRPLREHVEFL